MGALEKQFEELRNLLRSIYKSHPLEDIDSVWSQLLQIFQENSDLSLNDINLGSELWDASTVVLIAYPDAIKKTGEPSLTTLKDLINTYLGNLASIIHILPFLKSTSDGGFAVSSHDEIGPTFGDWNALESIGQTHLLMADLILNHVSAAHPWVQQFINSEMPGSRYILSPSKEVDWSKVSRPRNSSLFTTFNSQDGNKLLWTTFGADQVDLNWKEPLLLVEFLKLIVRYLRHGVKWIRLDAVGFIWKEPGTSCLHREEVHKLVTALRIQLQILANTTVLITETNVPQEENLSYLQSGKEAHMAYNFPLPPLLLESIFSNKADLLNQWIDLWPELPPNTLLLNFSASHDGIGLRPLKGLINNERFHRLLVGCEKRGGLVSHRSLPDGTEEPYELNISWWSAMADEGIDPSRLQLERFVLSQLFVMALKGIPAFYLQAILASENDIPAFRSSGHRRDLNRHKFQANELYAQLKDEESYASKILNSLKSAMEIRSQLQAFHPDSEMKLIRLNTCKVVIISRGNSYEKVWAIYNFTKSTVRILDSHFLSKNDQIHPKGLKDILSNSYIDSEMLLLEPYQVMWLIKD